jgi:hypothetical protein
VLALAACGSDASLASPTSAAAAKLQAAATAMRTVLTFRFTADVVSGSQQVKVSGEFSAPDGLHETVTIGANTVEVLRVGSRAFRRDTPTAAWRAVPAANASAPTDPRSAFSVLAGVTDVRLQESSYAFTLGKPAAASLVAGSNSVTGTALLSAGRIVDLSYKAASPAVTAHLTYAGFNTTPAVVAPPV